MDKQPHRGLWIPHRFDATIELVEFSDSFPYVNVRMVDDHDDRMTTHRSSVIKLSDLIWPTPDQEYVLVPYDGGISNGLDQWKIISRSGQDRHGHYDDSEIEAEDKNGQMHHVNLHDDIGVAVLDYDTFSNLVLNRMEV